MARVPPASATSATFSCSTALAATARHGSSQERSDSCACIGRRMSQRLLRNWSSPTPIRSRDRITQVASGSSAISAESTVTVRPCISVAPNHDASDSHPPVPWSPSGPCANSETTSVALPTPTTCLGITARLLASQARMAAPTLPAHYPKDRSVCAVTAETTSMLSPLAHPPSENRCPTTRARHQRTAVYRFNRNSRGTLMCDAQCMPTRSFWVRTGQG